MRICQCLRVKRNNTRQCPPCSVNTCDDYWTWDVPRNTSSLQTYGNQGRTVLFHSDWSNGTVAVRAERPLPDRGVYYWEIDVSHRVFGTSLMFGLGTAEAALYDASFINIIGQNEHSWGLSHKGYVWHNGCCARFTDPFMEYTPTTVGLLYNAVQGTLTYYKDGHLLGVAFKNLHNVKKPLYPMISSTAARTEMTLGMTKRSFVNLQDRCCWCIVQCLKRRRDADQLPLPVLLRSQIKEPSRWSSRDFP